MNLSGKFEGENESKILETTLKQKAFMRFIQSIKNFSAFNDTPFKMLNDSQSNLTSTNKDARAVTVIASFYVQLWEANMDKYMIQWAYDSARIPYHLIKQVRVLLQKQLYVSNMSRISYKMKLR